ncbi:hypothetical protein UlMin_023107 [Ulmus minor]
MSEEIFPRIMGATTAKEAWDTLQKEFQGSKKVYAVKLQSFRRNFENLKMKDNETAKDYYSRIKEFVNQMRAYGENIADKKIVGKIIISCTEKYDSLFYAIEESKDIETLTPTEIIGSFEAHEKRINRRNENTTKSAFPSKININHMTKDETIFCNIDKIKTKVKIGNGEFVEAIRKCTIAVDTKKGKKYISEVLLDPNIAQNLLSDKSLIIARVKIQENSCFPIQWRYAIDTAMKAQVDESWLWHRRFGHFNFHGLKILRQKNMMRDLPTIKKQHQQPFPFGKAWRAKKPLELVHTDVCGPMRTPSNDQNRYFILFIDDYTRMTWFCEDEGVHHQLTAGYALEQNGVSKRKNRTVMETARAMLIEKGLPKNFSVEIVYIAVYLRNKCPTNAVKDMAPVETWSGRKPLAKHLIVFGCICYAQIPQEKRSKLDEKIEKGIFLSYST